MTCDTDNRRLVFDLLLIKIAPDLCRCLDAIHYRHAEVRKNEAIAQTILVGIFYLVEGFFPVNAKVDLIIHIDALAVEDYSHGGKAELFVIYNEYPFLLELSVLFEAVYDLVETSKLLGLLLLRSHHLDLAEVSRKSFLWNVFYYLHLFDLYRLHLKSVVEG